MPLRIISDVHCIADSTVDEITCFEITLTDELIKTIKQCSQMVRAVGANSLALTNECGTWGTASVELDLADQVCADPTIEIPDNETREVGCPELVVAEGYFQWICLGDGMDEGAELRTGGFVLDVLEVENGVLVHNGAGTELKRYAH